MEDESPLERIRAALALAVGDNAVFDGWRRAAVDSAATQVGIDRDQARLAFPKDQSGMVDAYIQAVDREMERRLPPDRLAAMKIRDRIRALVWTRLEIMSPAREAVRSALAILAMPQNAPLALRTGWRSADLMWRLAGDTATDYNHYTKRLTLGAVYASTLLAWLDDDSEGWADTGAFLDRRIDNVMQFEKWKAQWRGREHFSVSRFLGRLRYPPK
ncbi:COQ9 family protein [Sphingomonas sabuli]|uniref:COQ9 family protein n=1 Tax=Sphingomonas sabuli TaxID=2764186 RepID=A0A7G9L0J7_9SPHN|nr:COQ9 family protein [Sphingomonas sabuli]QNM82146.1 COQ9 family protein [Sphingomonas sabuli]